MGGELQMGAPNSSSSNASSATKASRAMFLKLDSDELLQHEKSQGLEEMELLAPALTARVHQANARATKILELVTSALGKVAERADKQLTWATEGAKAFAAGDVEAASMTMHLDEEAPGWMLGDQKLKSSSAWILGMKDLQESQ